MLNMDIQVVPNDLSDEAWHMPYIDLLLNQVLPKDSKMQDKIQREAW